MCLIWWEIIVSAHSTWVIGCHSAYPQQIGPFAPNLNTRFLPNYVVYLHFTLSLLTRGNPAGDLAGSPLKP